MVDDYSGTAPNQPMYVISVAAKMVGLHPQTLRHYEELGLVVPQRTEGNFRMYAPTDIDRLRQIVRLTDELGVNLAGVQIILDMRERLKRLQFETEARQAELEAEIDRLRKRLIEGL
ncbi:MAG: helix-turn-helix transcriptional regulator [Anaerolineae bacterium]|nr:helix-turn-helix transcriptional regulator [Anaerolineae bacterium]